MCLTPNANWKRHAHLHLLCNGFFLNLFNVELSCTQSPSKCFQKTPKDFPYIPNIRCLPEPLSRSLPCVANLDSSPSSRCLPPSQSRAEPPLPAGVKDVKSRLTDQTHLFPINITSWRCWISLNIKIITMTMM